MIAFIRPRCRASREGAFTNRQRSVFPSLTFPNHIAQITGTTTDRHGIVLNDFYDTSLKESFSFPNRPDLIRTEPIWLTAERQGVRTAVIDWPVSQAQRGTLHASYFGDAFDKAETDDHRMNRVLEILKTDQNVTPLRLVISYVSHLDTTGHRVGPESNDIEKGLLETDATIGRFIDAAVEWFKSTHPTGELYIVLTTDHGMVQVHTLVSLERLIGVDLVKDTRVVPSGPVACIYLDQLPEVERAARARAIVEKFSGVGYARAWMTKDVPASYHFAAPDRVGDVTVLLDPGYAFTKERNATTMPAVNGRRGMHGYDPAASDDLLGTAIIWRLRKPIGGVDLGPIDNTQWHATVAKLLGIEPGKEADQRAIVAPGL
ncbi:MAG: alkaline phosphatase family protein [Tepidisphaeraceae bacterium]